MFDFYDNTFSSIDFLQCPIESVLDKGAIVTDTCPTQDTSRRMCAAHDMCSEHTHITIWTVRERAINVLYM